MITYTDQNQPQLTGAAGSLLIPADDEITLKLAMLYEGQCEGLGATKAATKYDYSKARYFQLLHLYQEHGALALQSKLTGPKSNYRRTDEIVRQVIRHRFLDPDASVEVITQKLLQTHHELSVRSVQRIIADYGLQKKTLRT
jgi:transposase